MTERIGTALQAIRYALDHDVELDDEEALDFLAFWLRSELDTGGLDHFAKWCSAHPDPDTEEGR